MGVYQQYTAELNDKFGFLATWLPGTRLRLGDVGILKRDRFEFVTTLDDLGIPFKIRDISGAADYHYVSSKGVAINFHGNGKAESPGAAVASAASDVSINFTRANAVVFAATGCKTTLIERQDQLGRSILERYQAGNWPGEHVLVTELVTADSATILISGDDSAKVDLAARAKIATAGFSLADPSLELQVASSVGVATQILAASQLTPLFRASAVRRRIFSAPSFQTRSADSVERSNDEVLLFADIGYGDLE